MQIFAFKNEIEVWKKIENKPGLSIQNLYQRLVSEVIVCLYLYEKEANKLYLGFQVFDLLLTCWKITRAVEVSLSSNNRFYLSFRYKEWYHRKVETADSQATHYTNYLIAGLFVPFIIYKLYPLATDSYSYYMSQNSIKYPTVYQTYVFFLESSVLFILIFGFVMMTPQLYINYKLKSVDHLPWKTLIYRFIYTIIDDIFVFMIDLPWLQRMFSFRDGNHALTQMSSSYSISCRGESTELMLIGWLCPLAPSTCRKPAKKSLSTLRQNDIYFLFKSTVNQSGPTKIVITKTIK